MGGYVQLLRAQRPRRRAGPRKQRPAQAAPARFRRDVQVGQLQILPTAAEPAAVHGGKAPQARSLQRRVHRAARPGDLAQLLREPREIRFAPVLLKSDVLQLPDAALFSPAAAHDLRAVEAFKHRRGDLLRRQLADVRARSAAQFLLQRCRQVGQAVHHPPGQIAHLVRGRQQVGHHHGAQPRRVGGADAVVGVLHGHAVRRVQPQRLASRQIDVRCGLAVGHLIPGHHGPEIRPHAGFGQVAQAALPPRGRGQRHRNARALQEIQNLVQARLFRQAPRLHDLLKALGGDPVEGVVIHLRIVLREVRPRERAVHALAGDDGRFDVRNAESARSLQPGLVIDLLGVEQHAVHVEHHAPQAHASGWHCCNSTCPSSRICRANASG